MNVNKKIVISTNITKSNTLNNTNIGKTRSICENVGAIVANAFVTAVITLLFGSASGKSEIIFTRIDSMKVNIRYSLSLNRCVIRKTTYKANDSQRSATI